MKVNILGTYYAIKETDETRDPFLSQCDGYCDKTSKKIVIRKRPDECQLDDYDVYRRKVLRHEIIHAFLFESGLHENFTHEMGHDETYVDWVASQYPKLTKAFIAAGCYE